MTDCKHGLRAGCAYCHGPRAEPASQVVAKKPIKTRLADKMNDRMTALKRRLREIRGEVREE
ncbi:MAG: hypothetical protein ACREK6_08190 [Candidatus Rokuibacteriota bacterium]